MSTGISISSINRIKELAEEKKFAEALEILDTQNLEKSINPQFLRISGEIFRENKRYYDSRKILLKSHQMSPQGIRIIFELIRLYLELGYFTKAKQYYEQYKFYSTPEDTQRDYVEYMMRKAEGADFMELSTILIPILERMPEDRWNFEAVLLYDKLDRKDKALEECKYILENFKDSVYVDDIVRYIDDELDIDQCFYVFPKEEQVEDEELYGDLIQLEEKILEADHLRMYPPEARIMVEAEDKDGIDLIPVKDKIKFPIRKKNKLKDKNKDNKEVEDVESTENIEEQTDTTTDEKVEKNKNTDTKVDTESDVEVKSEMSNEAEKTKDTEDTSINNPKVKKEREAILDKILSKKLDKDKIKESAKQVAKAVKEIDKEKAKTQVKTVAESVKDNVIKAKDVLAESVGVKQEIENTPAKAEEVIDNASDNVIMDAIIESVVEEPKKTVGQVVTNEELDALIPDSLEAMTPEEIAEIELKKEEAERLELEALEAELNLKDNPPLSDGEEPSTSSEILEKEVEKESSVTEEVNKESVRSESENMKKSTDTITNTQVDSSSYELEKEKFMQKVEDEEEPLDSLGFITVVQSDVDGNIENAIPETANMLHQMIDNKEFYKGEDSANFESKDSYEDHGFQVEDFDFDVYRKLEENKTSKNDLKNVKKMPQSVLSVEEIYADKSIIDFNEIIPPDIEKEYSISEEDVYEKEEFSANLETTFESILEKPVQQEQVPFEQELVESVEEPIQEKLVQEELVQEEPVQEEPVQQDKLLDEQLSKEEELSKNSFDFDDNIQEDGEKSSEEDLNYVMNDEKSMNEEDLMDKELKNLYADEASVSSEDEVNEENLFNRQKIKDDISISDSMIDKLSKLKESR